MGKISGLDLGQGHLTGEYQNGESLSVGNDESQAAPVRSFWPFVPKK